MRKLLCAGIVFAMVLVAGGSVGYGQGTQKGAAGGITEKTCAEWEVAFNRKTMVEAYKAVGARDAKWDAEAVAVLERMSVVLAYDLKHPMTPRAEAGSWYEMIGEMSALVEKKCDDPLVLGLYAQLAYQHLNAELAAQSFKRAIPLLVASKYHPVRVHAVLRNGLQLTSKNFVDDKVRKEWEGKLVEVSLKMASEKDVKEMGGLGERRVLEELTQGLNKMPMSTSDQVAAAMEKAEGLHPFVRDTYLGEYHMHKAFQARGTGWANEVTPEGWKVYAKHMKLGRKYLLASWEKYPQHPEAAAQMLDALKGAEAEVDETPRLWFERATKAQVDFQAAYGGYISISLPRWGGSNEEMTKFAYECLKSKRYDTWVPAGFLSVMMEIQKDTGIINHWKTAEVYDGVLELVKNYDWALKQRGARQYLYNYWAMVAARVGKPGDAVKAFDVLKGDYLSRPWDEMNTIAAWEEQRCRAVTGAFGKEVSKGDSADRKGNPADAAKAFKELLGKLTEKDATRAYVQRRLFETENAEKLNAGEWINVQPTGDLNPWVVEAGSWKVDAKGQLVGSPGERGMRMILGFRMAPEYEMRGRVEMVKGSEKTFARAGSEILYCNTLSYVWVNVMPRQSAVLIEHFTGPLARTDVKLKGNDEFCAAVSEGHVWGGVNGQYVVRMQDGARAFDHSRVYVSVGVRFYEPGQVFRFSELRIRKLKEVPATKDLKEGR